MFNMRATPIAHLDDILDMQDADLFIDIARVEILARHASGGDPFRDTTKVAETIAAMYVAFFLHVADPLLTLGLGFTTSTCLHPAGRSCTIFYAIFYAMVLPIALFEHD